MGSTTITPTLGHHDRVERRTMPRSGVAVWILKMDSNLRSAVSAPEWFDTQELIRFHSYVHDVDRHRFVVRRGFLRDVLSSYLEIDRYCVRIGTRALGKLWCIDDPSVEFNTSSTGSTCVVAVGAAPLGVDVESPRTITHSDEVAKRWLTAGEQTRIQEIHTRDQRWAITRVLVRKEAVLKAAGAGLSISPRAVHVPNNSGVEVISIPTTPVTGWYVNDVDMYGSLICAVATSTPSRAISVVPWPARC